MGALFERPAFLVLLLLVLAVVVIVVVVVRAAASGGKPPAAPRATGPGWYPQPDGTQRYWDGQAWTDHTA